MPDTDGEPSAMIGDSVIFENEAVRVWELRLRPGAASAYHRHDLDYLFIYPGPSQIEIRQGDGSTHEFVYEPGFVQFVNVGTGTAHQVRNTATDDQVQYIVEMKDRVEPAPSGDNGRRTSLRSTSDPPEPGQR